MRRLQLWLDKRHKAALKRREIRDLDAALEIVRAARVQILLDRGSGYWQARNIANYLYENRRIAEMM